MPTMAVATDGEKEVDLSVTHPLQRRWTLYFDTTVNTETTVYNLSNYSSQVKKVATFSTVEEFWSVMNTIAEPSLLQVKSTYHFFKEHIAPQWEDPNNGAGGLFTLRFDQNNPQAFDEAWIRSVLALVGENFEDKEIEDICGLVLAVRKGQLRLSLWTRSALDQELHKSIATRWSKIVEHSTVPEFNLHLETMSYGRARK